MPNLLNFPMDKLCYDLFLEVIDELEPKDVPQLMQADRRIRWILLQKPARILGKQIHLMSVEMDDRDSRDDERECYEDRVLSMKFAESRPLPFYFFSHKVLLLSQVERCSVLKISEAGWGFIDRKQLSALKKAFANLKQVDELEVQIYEDNFNDCLWNLKAEVTDRASLKFCDLQGEVYQALMLYLINGSLQNCKMISVDLYRHPDFYPTVYSALSKTQLELFVTEVYLGNVKSTIELILNSGIPSGNKEAACFVRDEMTVELMLSLLNGSLQNCKMIAVDLCPDFNLDFYPRIYSALSTTQLELFMTGSSFGKVKSTIEWILNSGIPSGNKEAACFVRGEMAVVINTLIKNFPKIRQVNQPNKTLIGDTMRETLRKHRFMDNYCDHSRSGSPRPRSRPGSDSADSADSRSDSDDSLSVSDDSLSVSAESDYCDHSRSPPPAPPRSRSVSVSAESLHSMDRNPMKRGVEHYESISDSDHSLRSMDRSPIKKRVRHSVSLGVPIDRSPPPRSRPRSVSVSAESLSVSGDSRSDSDDSLHSLDRSPAKRAFNRCHRASVDCPFDCYLKRIDEKRDCIYVVCHGFFFAKYVSSIQF